MSREKVLELMRLVAGNATTKELRVLAKKKYPKLSLHRTLHTTLKQLEKEGVIIFDEVEKRWFMQKLTVGEATTGKTDRLTERLQEEALVLPDLPEEMKNKKVILKVTEDQVREKMNEFEINPNAKIFKIKNPDPNAVYHMDGNKEPIWGSNEDPTRLTVKGKFKYRDRHEIARNIVQSIQEGKTRTTAIMYSSWLSHYQLKKYLRILLENGLINRSGENQYSVTAKGLEFIDAMKKVSEIKFD